MTLLSTRGAPAPLPLLARAAALTLALGALGPPAALAASVKVEPDQVVLGRTESVRLELTLDEPPGTEDRPLQLKVNVGSFGVVQRLGPGRYAATYVPPTTRFPQVALIAAWRETGPEAPIDFFRVPLWGVTKVPVKAKPGSELTVAIGEVLSPPVVAGAKGDAVLTLAVPPGVTVADLSVKEPTGVVMQRRLPIDVPPYNRLTAALVPHALRADGKSWVRLEVFYDLGGADVPPSRLKVTASVGTVGLLQAKEGRYTYRYAPPETAKESVKLSVGVQGDAASTASATLSLTAPAATRLVLRPPEAPLPADGVSTATVQVLALDDAGLGVTGQRVELSANGTPLAVTEQGPGLYVATLRAPAAYPPDGQLLLSARVGGTSLASTVGWRLRAPSIPATLEATLRPDPAPADGRTEVEVLLAVRDGAGDPLRGGALELRAAKGRVGPVTELEPGRYRGTWTPAEGLEGEVALEVRDVTGAFSRPVVARLRRPPRFELGLRGGLLHTLGDQLSPRGALELWRDVLVGSVSLGLGVTAGYLFASQGVRDGAGAVVSQSTAHVLPLTVRAGLGLVARGPFTLTVGVGGIVAVGFFSTTLTGALATGVGGGGLGFLAAGLELGPGRLVLEAGYGYAPVRAPGFTVQAGGLFVDVGYRFFLSQ